MIENENEMRPGLRWLIRKGRPGIFTNLARPWQLWLVAGDAMGLKAERSSHALCVMAMTRLTESERS